VTRRAVRTARIAGAITMLVGSALAGWIEPAAATGLGGTAWWWRPQQDPPVLKAPNVPDGGFMVQGAPDDPTTTFPDGASAIAAIRFTLDKGQANPVLTLKLVKEQSQAGPNPIIYACQAGSAWGAASGPQAWAAHPKPDCTKSVQGQIAADGSAIVFPAGPLQFNDQLDVILVPGIDPALPAPANSSVFTFVFEPPTQAALVTSAGTPPPPPPPPASFTAPTGAPATGEGSFTAPAATSFTPPVAALPPSQQGQTATAPVVNAATTPSIPVRSADNNDDNNSQLIGLLVLLAGAGIAFWSYRSSQAGASGPRTADGEHIGGLGRFARPREGIAPRLG
jgi:hypothetical protein